MFGFDELTAGGLFTVLSDSEQDIEPNTKANNRIISEIDLI